jgi:hypothetical protein
MSNNADDFVAIIAILVVFGLPLSYAIVNRVFAHHERLEMIKRGITPPPDPRWARRMARGGWCDPSAYTVPQTGASSDYDPMAYAQWQASRQLHKGITLAMIGLALTVGLSFIRLGEPGPWLLGGLIPLFVGFAQIVIAMLSGARLGPYGFQQMPPNQSQPFGGGQPQPNPFAARRDIPPGPYAWRPGPTTELEKPVPPPDVK